MAQNSRPCSGCGENIYRTMPAGPIAAYCSSDCRPRCSVEGCDRHCHGKTYCTAHHTRWKRTGDPLTPMTRGRNSGPCSIDGCDQPMRKTGWCAGHYAQQKKTGMPPVAFKYKWSDGLAPCPNCGSTDRIPGQRVYCSYNCRAAFDFYGGPRPTETACVACGVSIDLTTRGKKGQQTKAIIKFCRPCKRDYGKYKLSARELAVRDGVNCGICGDPVDMNLRRSESKMCASVDHVMPRAKGGTHEPGNLQLAHLYCNMLKSDRI